jgi:hypothetical protein
MALASSLSAQTNLMSSRTRRMTALTLLVLAALIGADLEGSFLHHDDGCVVEIHCIACRLTLGSTAVLNVVAVNVGPALPVVGAVATPATGPLLHATLAALRPRGPPSA